MRAPGARGPSTNEKLPLSLSQGRYGSLKSHLAIQFKNVWQLPFLSNMNRARMGPGVEILEVSRRQGLLEGLLTGFTPMQRNKQKIVWLSYKALERG